MDTMFLILPGLAAVLLITALVLAVRSRGFARVGWVACALVIGAGATLLFGIIVFPPEEYDEAGQLIGEMPKAFGPSLALTGLGMIATLAGLIVRGVRRVLRRRRRFDSLFSGR